MSSLRILICKLEMLRFVFSENFLLRLFNANVKQVINVSQIVAKKMISAGKPGAIVNVSSQVRIHFYLPMYFLHSMTQASQAALADHTVYCGTKGALDMITK